jgi:hypothetical protein
MGRSPRAKKDVSVIFARELEALEEEAEIYSSQEATRLRDKWMEEHPESAEEDADLETTEAGVRG